MESKEDANVVLAKKSSDLQRMKIEKLMKNPEKPVFIPERPQEKGPKATPDFVRNVWGSSAGAGSGEFHVYRGIRRREYARQKFHAEKTEEDKKNEEYQEKLLKNKIAADDRTAKKRNKRLKKKWKQKNNKKQKLDKKVESESESEEEPEEDNDAEETNNDAGNHGNNDTGNHGDDVQKQTNSGDISTVQDSGNDNELKHVKNDDINETEKQEKDTNVGDDSNDMVSVVKKENIDTLNSISETVEEEVVEDTESTHTEAQIKQESVEPVNENTS